jgi:bifunctional non-homologous end joining protein LigD
VADKLDTYRGKRDFERTAEPSGKRGRKPKGARFVVQEHHARRLHWDLRMEHDGVAVSWALPRGVPAHPDENRLAVHTEDHPLEYLEFEGQIPKGEYGAGTMLVWDRGTYEAEKFRENEVIATFHGERLNGRYAIFQTRGKDWLIHRMDPPEDPGYEPMPDRLAPMLARSGPLPRDEEKWGFEVKWDGIRTVVFCDHGHIELQGRNFSDFTPRYPEVRELARAVGARRMILDGEIVAFDEQGRPSFERLQSRMHLASDSAVKRRMRDIPVTYVAFDLLYLDGRSTLPLRYEQRREVLEALELEGPAWRVPAYHPGEGSALLAATRDLGIEGIVAKRLDSTYEAGRRSSGWVKVKNVCEQDVVIGGWTPGEGGRSKTLGALAAGVYEDGELVYAGKVGSGFTEQTLALLQRELESLRRADSPFPGRQPPKGTNFVEPRLVARVELREWTGSGTMRAPSFKGLRPDIDPQECVREAGADQGTQ